FGLSIRRDGHRRPPFENPDHLDRLGGPPGGRPPRAATPPSKSDDSRDRRPRRLPEIVRVRGRFVAKHPARRHGLRHATIPRAAVARVLGTAAMPQLPWAFLST